MTGVESERERTMIVMVMMMVQVVVDRSADIGRNGFSSSSFDSVANDAVWLVWLLQ